MYGTCLLTAWWVEPALLDAALLALLSTRVGLRHDSRLRTDDALVAFLATAQGLLVLDNCEHVVDACAHLAAAVLKECPGTRLLVTSREPLLVRGEHQLQLAPLATADPESKATLDETAQVPAVQLFVERAQDVAGFLLTSRNVRAVLSVCSARRTAAGDRALPPAHACSRPAQILERLDDCFGLLVSSADARCADPPSNVTCGSGLELSTAFEPSGWYCVVWLSLRATATSRRRKRCAPTRPRTRKPF
jgi:non-specific serine/threonine protein kinase